MILPVQESEICCHLDFHSESQPRNVLKTFLGFQEIEPIVLINVFLYKKRSVPMKGHGEHLKFKSQLYMCLPVLGCMASCCLAETKNDHGIMLSPSIAWCGRNLFQLLVLLNNLSLLLSLRLRSPQNFLDEIHFCQPFPTVHLAHDQVSWMYPCQT